MPETVKNLHNRADTIPRGKASSLIGPLADRDHADLVLGTAMGLLSLTRHQDPLRFDLTWLQPEYLWLIYPIVGLRFIYAIVSHSNRGLLAQHRFISTYIPINHASATHWSKQ